MDMSILLLNRYLRHCQYSYLYIYWVIVYVIAEYSWRFSIHISPVHLGDVIALPGEISDNKHVFQYDTSVSNEVNEIEDDLPLSQWVAHRRSDSNVSYTLGVVWNRFHARFVITGNLSLKPPDSVQRVVGRDLASVYGRSSTSGTVWNSIYCVSRHDLAICAAIIFESMLLLTLVSFVRLIWTYWHKLFIIHYSNWK